MSNCSTLTDQKPCPSTPPTWPLRLWRAPAAVLEEEALLTTMGSCPMSDGSRAKGGHPPQGNSLRAKDL